MCWLAGILVDLGNDDRGRTARLRNSGWSEGRRCLGIGAVSHPIRADDGRNHTLRGIAGCGKNGSQGGAVAITAWPAERASTAAPSPGQRDPTTDPRPTSA